LENIPCILLAAGPSSRLGKPKQLVLWNGRSLLEHTVETVLEAGLGPLFVVTGAFAEPVKQVLLKYQQVCVVHHPRWENGLGSSISQGVLHIQSLGNWDAVLLLLCDQPYLNADILTQMAAKHQQYPSDIIQCKYEVGQGPPVLFPAEFFEELIALEGQEGARKIIQEHSSRCRWVAFKLGHIDIDTPEDLLLLEQ
jgi:molybdenum cofactor cytidylyltransferase